MKKLFNDKGYTLIELLAVIIIMVTVGMIILSILVSALRGGNRSQTTNEVRESGNYVMSQMSKMITFATGLDGLSTDGAKDINGDLSNKYDLTKCVSVDQYKDIEITSYGGGKTIFSCDGNTISANSVAMLSSSFNVSNCAFTCTQPSSSVPPIINISFTISENKGSFTEKQASIPFETSIVIRNL